MKKKQQGLSLIGTLIIGVFLAFVLLLGFRTIPAVNEYLALQRILKVLADEGDNGASVAELRRSFERRADVDDIETVGPADLVISKQSGKVVIEVEYSRKVPVMGNVSLLIDFSASSEKG